LAFQFQYGSIKSLSLSFGDKTANKFQFQYGSIKSGSNNAAILTASIFQFQYGSIKRCMPSFGGQLLE